MTSKRPPRPTLSPDVLEARRVQETMERELIFGMMRSYRFYQQMRDVICVHDPERGTHRMDFSVNRYNTLFRAIDAYYRRYDNRQDIGPDFQLHNVILANTIVDWANKNGVDLTSAQELLAEIKEEKEFTNKLELESLTALTQGPAFRDWLTSRGLEQTVGKIQAQKGLGTLTLANLEEMVAKMRMAVGALNSKRQLARPLGDFQKPAEDAESVLIGPGRFLCRGALALLTGSSGIGKSSLVMQMAICFANAREVFGFKPRGALRLLMVQGENDDGDISEMRDGVYAGSKLSDEQIDVASKNISVLRSCGETGKRFFEHVLRPNLQHFKPDLLIVDPVLAFLGGDSREQAFVGDFLRTNLITLLEQFDCACLLVHHTNKPPNRNGNDSTPNTNAYPESGSAEFRNAARGSITLLRIEDTGVFELSVPKRGTRLGWTDEAGQPTCKQFIRHTKMKGRIFWENATEDDADQSRRELASRAEADLTEAVHGCVPSTGTITQNELLQACKAKSVGDKKARSAIKLLLADGRIEQGEQNRKGARAEITYCRKVATTLPGGDK